MSRYVLEAASISVVRCKAAKYVSASSLTSFFATALNSRMNSAFSMCAAQRDRNVMRQGAAAGQDVLCQLQITGKLHAFVHGLYTGMHQRVGKVRDDVLRRHQASAVDSTH